MKNRDNRDNEYIENDDFAWEDDVDGEYSEEGEYYEDGEYSEEGEYYEDEYYEEDGAEFEGEIQYEEEPYYEEDADLDYIYEEPVRREPQQKKGILFGLEKMDLIMAISGVAVIIIAIVIGIMLLSPKKTTENHESTIPGMQAALGSQLKGIDLVGERGIAAIEESIMAKILADIGPIEDEDDTPGYLENDYSKTVAIAMSMTSIQKDLKIKFTNRDTKKLVANVPFVVTIGKPDGTTEDWSDNDYDGIIYKSGLTPGSYTVTLQALTDERYSNYVLPSTAQKVDVRKDIAYQKVDVANEVKKESEINASKEDTKKKEITTESSLTNTVEWVASSKNAASFVQVEKKDIIAPLEAIKTTYVAGSFSRVAAVVPSQGAVATTVAIGDTVQFDATVKDDKGVAIASENITSTTWTTSKAEVLGAAPTAKQLTWNPSALAEGETTVTCVVRYKEVAPSVSPSESPSEVPSEEPSGEPSEGPSEEPSEAPAPGEDPSPAPEGQDLVNPGTDKEKTFSWTIIVEKSFAGEIKTDKTDYSVVVGGTLEIPFDVTGYTDNAYNFTAASADQAKVNVSWDATAKKLVIKGLAATETGTTVAVTLNTDYKDEAKKKPGVTNKSKVLNITVVKSNLVLKTEYSVYNVYNPKDPFNPASDEYTKTPILINLKVTGSALEASKQEMKSVEGFDSNMISLVRDETNKMQYRMYVGLAAQDNKEMTLTFTYEENGVQAKTTCKVVIKPTWITDSASKLYLKTPIAGTKPTDAANKIYVNEGGKYREATYKDYYTFSTFYKGGDAKYTGWQTIDGKVYFFKADGTAVTGKQVILGAEYNFGTDGALIVSGGITGIDVSKWNGSIDWAAVKNSGISYAIIRVGYRGSSQGSLIEDPKFAANIKGATEAGIKVGVYFFTQAINEVEAVEEASMVIDKIKGYKITYPVFLDVESSGGRADKIDKNTRTAVCKAFCETVKNAGYTSGVYANKTWFTDKIDASALSAYKIWLAQYAAAPTYTGRYDIWQRSDKGKVTGISGDVDMNISYLGY